MTWPYGFRLFAGSTKLLFDRMMVTGRTKVDCFIKSDSFFAVNPVCLCCLILTPAAPVYYHVE